MLKNSSFNNRNDDFSHSRCAKIACFLYYYAAVLAHSCLISPPQWLIAVRKCPTISPDAACTFWA